MTCTFWVAADSGEVYSHVPCGRPAQAVFAADLHEFGACSYHCSSVLGSGSPSWTLVTDDPAEVAAWEVLRS